MSLGRRTARHDTVASRHEAVIAEYYHDHAVQDRVRTLDGLLGTVTAVNDGPVEGYEDYEVALDHGLGVGTYTSSQLTAVGDESHQASVDYPELGTILVDRPDPAKQN